MYDLYNIKFNEFNEHCEKILEYKFILRKFDHEKVMPIIVSIYFGIYNSDNVLRAEV